MGVPPDAGRGLVGGLAAVELLFAAESNALTLVRRGSWEAQPEWSRLQKRAHATAQATLGWQIK